MLRAAREGLGTPSLARFMLVLAVGATLAANVGYGLPYGLAGAALSGWPAVAFIGCAEMAIGMVRRSRGTAGQPAVTQVAPADAEHAAQLALAASVAAGNPISQRQMMTRFGLTRTAERKVRQAVLAGSNGHVQDAA